jgi:hypothetical protein
MKEARCSVCEGPCESMENELCDKCRAVDEGLTHLIADNETMAIKYLETKLASSKERMPSPPLIDQRKKQVLYSPLRRKADTKKLWSHTPDRRTEQRETSQERRKSNGAERRKGTG